MIAAVVAFAWSGLSIAAALLIGAAIDLADRRRPRPTATETRALDRAA